MILFAKRGCDGRDAQYAPSACEQNEIRGKTVSTFDTTKKRLQEIIEQISEGKIQLGTQEIITIPDSWREIRDVHGLLSQGASF
jgi:hypothetical protein